MKLFLALFIISGVSLSTAKKSECKLPPPQDINWNKAGGPWYEFLNESTVQDKTRICTELRFIKTELGVDFLLNFKNKKGGEESLRSIGHRTHDGYFTDLVALEADFGKMTYYTDYENYLMLFECGKAGQALMWMFSRNPDRTAEDVRQLVVRKLAEIGGIWNKMKLRLVSCPE